MIDTAQRAPHAGVAPSKLRQWSSFVGIVTTIVGTILISFANGAPPAAQRWRWTQKTEQGQRLRHPTTVPGRGGAGSDQSQSPNAQWTPFRARQSVKWQREKQRARIYGPAVLRFYPRTIGKTRMYGRRSQDLSELPVLVGRHPSHDRRRSGKFLGLWLRPASIVSPLGVVALVSNCIIAPCLLKQRFRQRDFWGVVVAVGGAVTVLFSANNSEQNLGTHECGLQ